MGFIGPSAIVRISDIAGGVSCNERGDNDDGYYWMCSYRGYWSLADLAVIGRYEVPITKRRWTKMDYIIGCIAIAIIGYFSLRGIRDDLKGL